MPYTLKNNPTVFGQILRGEIPYQKVYEDQRCLAFHSNKPKAEVHIILIPKQHITNLQEADPEYINLLGYLNWRAAQIAEEQGLQSFRLHTNSGEAAGQTVSHLHYHITSGEGCLQAI